MQHSFQKFLQPGIVGFYRSACITSILLQERKNGKPTFQNIYTLVTLQETEAKSNTIRWRTTKPLRIGDSRSVMITYQDVDMGIVEHLYQSAVERGKWHQPNSNFPLDLEELTPLPPIFVPLEPKPPIHYGIKNPYRNCHYVFELFAEKKKVAASFTEKQRRQIAEWVMNTIPIDLKFLSDRWGNIVFQFPITLLKVNERGGGQGTKMLVNVAWHSLVSNPPEVRVDTTVSYDQSLLDYDYSSGIKPYHELETSTTQGIITTRVIRNNDQLILYEHSASLMNRVVISMQTQAKESRVVHVPQKRKSEPCFEYTVQLHHKNRPVSVGERIQWQERIAKRQHQESLQKLENEKFFVQYGSHGANDRRRALEDIRELVARFGSDGAYLWDPYCDGIDILSTLFACKSYGAPLKVITSFSKKIRDVLDCEKKQPTITFEDRKNVIINQLRMGGNHEGVNLEVRCQHGQHGWNFHDRFLLFPGDPPHVWSLGTSVNRIGSSHSILLKVEHAQPVIDAFLDLWEQLEGAVIWSSQKDM